MSRENETRKTTNETNSKQAKKPSREIMSKKNEIKKPLVLIKNQEEAMKTTKTKNIESIILNFILTINILVHNDDYSMVKQSEIIVETTNEYTTVKNKQFLIDKINNIKNIMNQISELEEKLSRPESERHFFEDDDVLLTELSYLNELLKEATS